MNITQFLSTDYSSKKMNTISTNHNSYTEIHNYLIIPNLCTVVIDRVLDIQGNCTIDANKTIFQYPINVNASFFTNNYKNIKPGSFIGNNIYDDTNQHIHKIYVNGYITNYGVLS